MTQIKILSVSCLLLLIIFSCDRELSTTPPEPDPSRTAISVFSQPADYSIYLDGRITGFNTPDTLIYIEPGQHEIELKHYIYADTLLSFNLEDNDTVSLSVNVEKHSKFRGDFAFRSKPSNAEIIINGNSTGRFTPDTLQNVYPGIYQVAFRKFGYRDYNEEVILKSDDSLTVYGELVDTTIWVIFNKDNSNLPTNEITSVSPSANLIGTSTYGVIKTNDPQWDQLGFRNCFISDIEGNYIMTLAYGVFLYENGSFKNLRYIVSGQILDINYSLYLSYNKIYICSVFGLGILQDNIISYMNSTNSDLPFQISCVNTYGSLMAVGSKSNGLYIRADEESEWSNYNTTNSVMERNKITAVAIGYDSRYNAVVYFATNHSIFEPAGRLYKLYKNEISEIEINESRVYAIEARAGRAWVATSNGLYRLTLGQNSKNYNTENSPIPTNLIYDVKESASTVWLATYRGLVIYKYWKDGGN